MDSDGLIGWNGVTSGNELAQLLQYATDDIDCIVGNVSLLTERDKIVSDSRFVNRRLGVFVPNVHTLKFCNATSWGKLYRKSHIERYKLRFPVGLRYEDHAFFPQCFALCRAFVLTPVPFYSYYIRDTCTNKRKETGQHCLDIIEKNFVFFTTHDLYPRFASYVLQHTWELYQNTLNLTPEACHLELESALRNLLRKYGIDHRGHYALSKLVDDTAMTKPLQQHISFKRARHFDKNLFKVFCDILERKIHSERYSVLARIANFIINRTAQNYLNHLATSQLIPIDTFFFPMQDYINALRECDVVSFDIFDTLLVRKLQKPTDLFKMIEITSNAPGFAHQRIYAERRARSEVDFEEITLDEIYDRLPTRFKKIQDTEKATESMVLYRNRIVAELYKAAVAEKKRIIAISDMYLA